MQLRAPSLAALLPAVLLALVGVDAHPYARDDLHDAGFGYLMPRGCAEYCGYDNQFCCSAGSSCYTSSGLALCAATGGGGYAVYTTTWTETETFTSTFSSLIPATTAVTGNCVPPEDSGWIACGTICCASGQYCAYDGQCSANAGAGYTAPATTGAVVTTAVVTTGSTITTGYSAPYRVTSGTPTVTTGTLESASATGNATLTGTSTAATLSPGAIAGIVVGVVVGVILLLMLCACFVVRNLWVGLLSLLGLGPRRRRREEVIIEEERYTRRGSTHSRRDRHDGWFGGGGGGRPSTAAPRREKRTNNNAGWMGLGAAGAATLLFLGLRRDNKRRANTVKTRTEVTADTWSESYSASDQSSRSSDRRTRDSRRTRETTTRVSRGPSRVSRGPSRR